MSFPYWGVVHLSSILMSVTPHQWGKEPPTLFLRSLLLSQDRWRDKTSQRTSTASLLASPVPSMVTAYGGHNGIFPSPDLKQVVGIFFSSIHSPVNTHRKVLNQITHKHIDLHLNHFVLEFVIKMRGNQNVIWNTKEPCPWHNAPKRFWLLSMKQPEPRMCSLSSPGLWITWESGYFVPSESLGLKSLNF